MKPLQILNLQISPRQTLSPVSFLLALLLSSVISTGALAEASAGEGARPTAEWDGEDATITLAEAQGGLLLRTDQPGRYRPAPAVATNVHLKVTGLIVRGRVEQRFANPTEDWVEGVYVFPLPEDAAVDTLELVVGDRLIEGQIREKGQARKEYQQAKREGRKASLVEQERPNIFTNSVANIGPGEEVEVVIEYQQVLAYERGEMRLRFPMVVAPRYIPGTPVAQVAAAHSPNLGSPNLAETLNRALDGEVDENGHVPGSGWSFDTDQVPDASRITPYFSHPASWEENPLSLTVELEPGFELDELGSSYHDVDLAETAPGTHLVTLTQGTVPANRDFELVWSPRRGQTPQAALFTEPFIAEDGSEATYALLMVLPPSTEGAAAPQRLPRETILIIDTSGSMHGESIVQARHALHASLDRLDSRDLFNIVQFNSRTDALFPSSEPVTGTTLSAARRYIDALEAEGGTEMLPALRAALEAPTREGWLRQVVFVTDGSVGNEQALFEYIRLHAGASRLFTVGIGSAPNSHFMSKAAQFGRGTFTYIGSPREVREKMEGLLEKLESPYLTDLQVAWRLAGAASSESEIEAWPRRLPDLYEGEPVVLAALLPGALDALGGAVAVGGLRGEDTWASDLSLRGGAAGAGIGKLWARRKIADLMDSRVEGADPDEVRSAVVDVALEHHLVSKYTSLVAVDVTPSRPALAQLASRAVPTELPHGWSPQHVPGALPQGGTASRLQLLAGLALLALALGGHLLTRGNRS